jgi:hypothetical protein
MAKNSYGERACHERKKTTTIIHEAIVQEVLAGSKNRLMTQKGIVRII